LDFGGGCAAFGFVAGGDDNVEVAAGKLARGFEADAAIGTGDEDDWRGLVGFCRWHFGFPSGEFRVRSRAG
jgi:hypothetical protein